MQRNEKIVEALAGLDHTDPTLWTSSGEVRVEVVSAIVGESLTRAHIRDAAPDFKRNFGDEPLAETPPEISALQRLQEQAESRQRRLDSIGRQTAKLQDELAGVRAVRAEINEREKAIQSQIDKLAYQAAELRAQESYAYRVRRHNQQAMQEIKDRYARAEEKGMPLENALAPCDRVMFKQF